MFYSLFLAQLYSNNPTLNDDCAVSCNYGFLKMVNKLKNTFYAFVVVIVLSLLANVSLAGDLSNIYFGVGAGSAKVDLYSTGADKLKDTDVSAKAFVGQNILPYLAIEGGYIHLGQTTAHYSLFNTNTKYEASALYLSGVGKVDLNKLLFIQGKLGLSVWFAKADANFKTIGKTASGDDYGVAPMFGIGIGFKVADGQLRFLAEWERYQDIGKDMNITVSGLTTVKAKGTDVDHFGLALILNF